MRYILGLDLGTNSVGWAVVEAIIDEDGKEKLVKINSLGSRIIPMDAATLGDFNAGKTVSKTKNRTERRLMRRILQRKVLRRERLLRVLSLMNFLPKHYAQCLDRYGKIISDPEPKLAWVKEDGCYRFLFQESFSEMLSDFYGKNPELRASGKRIPYDWTIYYLRKKALTQKITKEELAWILLHFNQKRGYYQLRVEEDQQSKSKREDYYELKVISVEDTGEKKGKRSLYKITFENGWEFDYSSVLSPDWVGKTKSFIVTTELEKDGKEKTDDSGKIKRSFRAPKDDDWELLKKKAESGIEESHKTVGTYIYDALLQNPQQKIRAKLISTIDRKYYKDELNRILEKQKEFHTELNDRELYEACVDALYPNNLAHRDLLYKQCDFTDLLVEDILFYQRPLKSKKSLIDECPYESHVYKKAGKIERVPLKCIARSHPLYQEFRLWQFISNLRIYQRQKEVNGKLEVDADVTSQFLKSESDYVVLYEWLNSQKEIKQNALLKHLRLKSAEYRWNYVEDKAYPCNATHALLIERLGKAGVKSSFLNGETEESLWHLLYSISDLTELKKALQAFAGKHNLDVEPFVGAFLRVPPFEKRYGAYSAKAIKKLLPLMRMGKYWREEAIDSSTRVKITKIITGEYDAQISERVREKVGHLEDVADFCGFPLWKACYLVYGRHSEPNTAEQWKEPSDIDRYLKSFKQHSLRNPIVEQVIMEALRTVRDIWKQVGRIDEIHVELGREMKNPADKRAAMTKRILENENTNLRIKSLLYEFMNNPEWNIEDVHPYSPMQQEKLRIYEEGAMAEDAKGVPVDILRKFNEKDAAKRPTKSDVVKYKLWLEQHYHSPYTGEGIPLAKLFTPAYEIEHVIPRKRYFDDSLSNKVICESAVNKLKGAMTGYEFIKNRSGEIVLTGEGNSKVEIFSVEKYEQFVKDNYSQNRAKMRKLLMEDIPDDFIDRQLNDSRYISRMVKSLLSNVVRENGELEATSKNVIVCSGGVTDRLKKDWGINDVWNKIILPRFERLNELSKDGSTYTVYNKSGKLIPYMPLEYQKGFNKKRIDHRHHAMDAIVIACASRNIINYLNNESAKGNAEVSRRDLQKILCSKQVTDEQGNYQYLVDKPWSTFTQDVYTALSGVIASFKQNIRVIGKASNYYWHYNESGKKVLSKQVKGNGWTVRKPLHKDTFYGEVNIRKETTTTLKKAIKNPKVIVEKDLKRKLLDLLREGVDYAGIKKYFETNKDAWQDVNLQKIRVYCFTDDTKDRFFASRKLLNDFSTEKIEKIEDKIGKVTDTGIQKILRRHLAANGGDPQVAFSPEGIERMNANLAALNLGKLHQPIYKVRICEEANKYPVGERNGKIAKFVEAAKGTNLFFAVYESESVDKQTGEIVRKRVFDTVPLRDVIERQMHGLSSVPETDSSGNQLKFVLSPNDLVYVPTEAERAAGKVFEPINKERIYKMVSCNGSQCFFIKSNVAAMLRDKFEFTSSNKMECALTKEMIKEICIPIKVDRLGNIIDKNLSL